MFTFTDTKGLSEAGAWVHIQDKGRPAYWPDAKGNPDKKRPVRIKVMGADSSILQERIRKRGAKRLKELGGSVDMSKKSTAEIEAMIEIGESDKTEYWADATLGWENMPGTDGEPAEFSRGNAQMIYSAHPAIIRQLDADVGDINDFLALAAPN